MTTHLRLMTFNLRVSAAHDGPNHWPARWPHVRALIREVRPDILGAQECMPDQLLALRAALYDYLDYAGPDTMCCGGESQPLRNPLFVRQDAPLAVEEGVLALNVTGVIGHVSWDGSEARIAHWLRFPGLTVVNTHFDAWDNFVTRRESARLIVELLKDAPAAVVMGDLNCQPDSEPISVFRQAGFALAKDTLPAEADRRTFHQFSGQGIVELDYVLLRGAVVTGVSIPRPRHEAPFASDHDPLVVDITL